MSTIQTPPQLHCQQIMRGPVETVFEDDTVACAARRMRERNVGFLPVCDRRNVVVGVVTDRDIVTRVAAEDRRASILHVSKVMTRAVLSCKSDETVADVERLMCSHRITRVVIVDSDGRPTGVISLSDLAQYEGVGRLGRTLRTIVERKYAAECP